jgi:hypothetical protein
MDTRSYESEEWRHVSRPGAMLRRSNASRPRMGWIGLCLVSLLTAPVLTVACSAGFWVPGEASTGAAAAPVQRAEKKKRVFVSTNGRPNAKGTKQDPLDLATALGDPGRIAPGSTVFLRGGTYSGTFTSKLHGEPGKPITVRPFKNEHVVIDAWNPAATTNKRQAGLVITGAWVIFTDLEVTSSDPRRVAPNRGSTVRTIPGWRDDGVEFRASNSKLINLVIHDTGQGIGFWDQAIDSEVYGCILYNNGWDGPDRGHGHGLYIQNEAGTKLVQDVISFNNFATGMKAYGQESAAVGVHFDGVISFNNGAGYFKDRSIRNEGILIGTTKFPPRDIKVLNSFLYTPAGTIGGGMRLGYLAENENVEVRGNHFASGGQNLWLVNWRAATVRDNFFYTTDAQGSNVVTTNVKFPDKVSAEVYDYDNNDYFDNSPAAKKGTPRSFSIEGVASSQGAVRLTFDEWRQARGWDANSRFTAGRPTGVEVFVRPNKYEAGRAHIVVFNWDLAPSVDVDVSDILPVGADFEIRSAEDYYGDAVVSGVSSGRPIRVPLDTLSVALPFGYDFKPPSTRPEFAVFVLVRR